MREYGIERFGMWVNCTITDEDDYPPVQQEAIRQARGLASQEVSPLLQTVGVLVENTIHIGHLVAHEDQHEPNPYTGLAIELMANQPAQVAERAGLSEHQFDQAVLLASHVYAIVAHNPPARFQFTNAIKSYTPATQPAPPASLTGQIPA